LTGLFLGRIQASLNATAHSYGYDEVGPIQLNFSEPPRPQAAPPLVSFNGRLPGFHIIFINVAGKGLRAAQAAQAVEYETDVNIDFAADPPTITGTIRPKNGGPALVLDELYPEVTLLTANAGLVDGSGRRVVTIRFGGRGPAGEVLDYTLVMRILASGDGNVVDGTASVQRTLRVPGAAPEVVQGTGTVDLEKQPAPPMNTNTNANTGGGANGGGSEASASACIPGLSQAAAFAVDEFVQAGGRERLDLDADGTVTSAEVQQSLNPVLEPFSVALAPEAADCIAELLNR
jgi:hypothetical protein